MGQSTINVSKKFKKAKTQPNKPHSSQELKLTIAYGYFWEGGSFADVL